MRHYFDPDEFSHLFRAYLIANGQVPYRDFGYYYSPLFATLFAPLFSLLPEQATVVLVARGLNFFIFFLTTVAIFAIGKLITGVEGGLLAAFFTLSCPRFLLKQLKFGPTIWQSFFG